MIWALLGSRTVRLVGGAFIAVSVIVGAVEAALWAAGRRGEVRGAERVIVKTNIDAEKQIGKVEENRARADGVGDPVAELRKRTCPSCQ